jgi:hypothetical protein
MEDAAKVVQTREGESLKRHRSASSAGEKSEGAVSTPSGSVGGGDRNRTLVPQPLLFLAADEIMPIACYVESLGLRPPR